MEISARFVCSKVSYKFMREEVLRLRGRPGAGTVRERRR